MKTDRRQRWAFDPSELQRLTHLGEQRGYSNPAQWAKHVLAVRLFIAQREAAQ